MRFVWPLVVFFIGGALAALDPGDKDALLKLYNATNGARWEPLCGWEEAATCADDFTCDPCYKTACNETSWFGVTCTPLIPGILQRVVALQLQNASLDGVLPSELANLPELKLLNLNNNYLRGVVPALPLQLETLSLSNNNLNGVADGVFEGTLFLQFIDLSINYITGPILSNLSFISTLQSLNLSGNNIADEIPASLLELPQLTFVDLSGNMLTGSLPDVSVPLNGQYLLLHNSIQGSIPESWCSPYVNMLSLSFNILTGTIPTCVGNMTALTTLVLEWNCLTGTVPDLSPLSNLSALIIDNNLMHGTVNESVCALTQLTALHIGQNQFTGTLPTCFFEMVNITYLGLRSNLFTGSLPSSIGNLNQVYRLDFSNNLLTGEIPETIGNCTCLSWFSVTGNMLTGTIPASLANLNGVLQHADFSENMLSGYLNVPGWNPWQKLEYGSFRGNNFTLSQQPGQNPPAFWNITFQSTPAGYACGMIGSLNYLDLTGVSTPGWSVNTLLENIVGQFDSVELCRTQAQNPDLQSLALNSMNLTQFSDNLFTLFPNLVVLGLSENQLAGEIQNQAEIPSTLVILDLSSNNLEGGLPSTFQIPLSESLLHLELDDNPLLSDEPFPSYLSPSWNALRPYTNFYCPQLTDSKAISQIVVDPTFYNWTYCFCSTNSYGTVFNDGGCSDAFDLCVDNTPCFLPDSTGQRPSSSLPPTITVAPGHYPAPSPSNVTAFLSCLPIDASGDTPCPGNVMCWVDRDNRSLICNMTGACAAGYEGRLCAGCVNGYYLGSSSCVPCESNQTTLFLAAAFVGFVMLVAFLRCGGGNNDLNTGKCCANEVVWMGRFRDVLLVLVEVAVIVYLALARDTAPWMVELVSAALFLSIIILAMQERRRLVGDLFSRSQSSLMPLMIALLKSFVVYLQSLQALGGAVMQQYFNFLPSGISLNMRFEGLECILSSATFYVKNMLFLSVPVFFLVIGFFALATRMLLLSWRHPLCRGPTTRRKFFHAANDIRERYTSVILLLFNLFFFEVCSRVFRLLNCDPDSSPGSESQWLDAFPNVECAGPEYELLADYAYGAMAFYVAILGIIIWRIYAVRDRLGDQHAITLFGFFYQPYRLHVWWYDSIILLRRILLAIFINFINNTSPFQSLLIVLTFVASIISQVRTMPFLHSTANLLDIGNMVVVVLSYVAVQTQALAPTSEALKLTVVVINLVTVLLYVVAIAVVFIGIVDELVGRSDYRNDGAVAKLLRKFLRFVSNRHDVARPTGELQPLLSPNTANLQSPQTTSVVARDAPIARDSPRTYSNFSSSLTGTATDLSSLVFSAERGSLPQAQEDMILIAASAIRRRRWPGREEVDGVEVNVGSLYSSDPFKHHHHFSSLGPGSLPARDTAAASAAAPDAYATTGTRGTSSKSPAMAAGDRRRTNTIDATQPAAALSPPSYTTNEVVGRMDEDNV